MKEVLWGQKCEPEVGTQFRMLTLPLSKLEINPDKAEIHMCKNTNVSTV